MNKQYKDLFTLIARTIANLAEQVMNNHIQNNEEKEQKIAETMRDDYLDLIDKIDSESLVKADFARLLVGTVIIVNQLENKIKTEQTALQEYKVNIIPKLDQINNATEEETTKLAEQLFEIKENSQE